MIVHIVRRELRAWLGSPFAWVVAGTFLVIEGLLFTVLLGAHLRMGQQSPDFHDGVPLLQGLI